MEQQSYKRNVLVCLITNVILAFLLIRAEHWNFSDGYFHEVVYGAVIATLIFVIPLLYPRFTFLQNLYQKAENLGSPVRTLGIGIGKLLAEKCLKAV